MQYTAGFRIIILAFATHSHTPNIITHSVGIRNRQSKGQWILNNMRGDHVIIIQINSVLSPRMLLNSCVRFAAGCCFFSLLFRIIWKWNNYMTLSQLHPPHTDRIHCKRIAIGCWRTNEQKKYPEICVEERKKKMNTTRARTKRNKLYRSVNLLAVRSA